MDVPVKYLGDLFDPHVSVTFFMDKMLTPEEESYIERIISSWFDVGAHQGFGGDGNLHCLNKIIFDFEKTIYVDVDLGGAPNEALDALFRIVDNALGDYNVKVRKIEVD